MSRSQEHEIAIEAPADAVWRALTDAEELTRWFVEDARVTPGEGGTVWLSWGSDLAGESTIDVWEPGRRLRTREESWGEGVTLFEEWTLETRGGKTVLRLVHSGIPDSPDWDGMYDSTNKGWGIFLRMLRHYLERHPGEPRRTVYTTTKLESAEDGLWERLTRPDGPVGSLVGEVLISQPGSALLAIAPELDDGLVALSHEGSSLWCIVSAFGEARDRLDAHEAPLRAEIEGVAA